MGKLSTALTASFFAIVSFITTADQAESHRYHRGGIGAGIAAAVIGGIIIHQLHRRRHRDYYYSGYDDYGYDDYPYYSRRSYYQPRYYGGYRSFGFGHHRGRGHW